MAVSEIVMPLASNPYFSAGFGLFGVGSAAAAGRALTQVAVAAFKREYVTTLQVPGNDKVKCAELSSRSVGYKDDPGSVW